MQWKFIKTDFAKQIEEKLIDAEIYKESRFMCMIGSTTYGINSYFTPIESDQQRYGEYFSILKALNASFFFFFGESQVQNNGKVTLTVSNI